MDLVFYHLEHAPLSKVLPDLLGKSLEKGWRAIIEAASEQQVEELDQMLWTYSDESFLPHGPLTCDNPAAQPILITTQSGNENQAAIRFFIDAGDVTAHPDYERLVYIFNGNNQEALIQARLQWKAAKAATLDATYWQQNNEGRWEKKA